MGLKQIDPYEMIDFAEWQNILDILSKMSGTKSAAITKFEQPYIEILKISACPEIPLYEGMSAELLNHYCEEVLYSQEKVLVTNATKQERWKNAPEIKHDLISYLGYPLFLPNGEIFGTLCVHNDQETNYSQEINDLMYQFKRVVESHLNLAELAKQHKESENRYKSLVENIADAIFQIDYSGKIQDLNPEACRRYGYTYSDFLELNFMELEKHNESHGSSYLIQEVIRKGKSVFESIHLDCHGSEIYSEVNAQVIDDPNIDSILIIVRDITERISAIASLRQSENYYRAIFETSGSAMFIDEEDTTISLANSNFEDLSGYSREEIEGIKSWTDFAHPDEVAWMKKNHYLRRQDPDAAPRQYEFRFITRSGEKRNILWAVDIISETHQSIASCIDITEQKRTENILQSRLYLMEYSMTSSFEDTLKATIDEAEKLTDSRIGFYHFLQEDQNTLSLQAWSTRTSEECTAWPQEEHYKVEEAGVWVDCVRRGEPIIHNEYASLPHKKGVPQGHPSILRELVVPIYKGETIVAMLGVGNKPGDYTSADIETVSLLGKLAWDITERKQLEEKLKEMSLYDSLTGLYSRNFFEEEMTRLSDGRYSPLGVIVCDLDGLKFINDLVGHQAGDKMIIKAADILRQSFRSSDIVARVGGDEFAVLLSQTGPKTVERMLQRLREAVRKYNSTEPELPLALSMGHAESNTSADLQALFREADDMMYREKIQQEGSPRSAILQALTKTMQARDFDTEGHCDRLQELAASLARSRDHSQEVINDLVLLARFHDLGKVGVPDHILFKQGALTEEEWEQMRKHCEIGHRIASSVPDLKPIADLILKHHEHWDGGGYPLGLSGENIPLESRVLAIVDAYDAMTSERPYRKAMSHEEAVRELRRCAGTQFDPDLVERFIQVLQEPNSK